MKAPPPTRTVLAGQETVTDAPEPAAAGPETSAFLTVMVGFVASVLQTAKAYVVLLVPAAPPFRPTAVHEPGFVPEVTGVPVALLGKLPMILRPPAVPGVVRAPPLSKRSPAGQVAVAVAIVSAQCTCRSPTSRRCSAGSAGSDPVGGAGVPVGGLSGPVGAGNGPV